ncbi:MULTISPECIES: DUF493 domain-containing protein [Acidithiobacillus]|jgi:putative lipoic acid-binding regulatory protein|uniref:DUF493 domain-containing protein n=3 Tax=Acidithiobacillus caldus TaxID=33059 RepID=F9ZRI7_ACICS|nr:MULTISPECIES: DUF493 domain-containing protein [Acidithiobacillus]AEK59025.1 conserved hypothetical protein [Acidithiobacillus caldus SM-1]AIA56074.1 putative lipoate regulatory protein YbeD [Acidithiobacillus caldus ATCC 51756]AUW33423.1 DUF493 domain-containing protein [Acidithiobacillus caldus]MBU2730641.1 DUF493 domain-containing protein [Acidithiobacillus caldus]MBU2736233.1 DUF493 domain-containing protein [Acidithiobacillus caldus ATCC 51756]
MTATGLESGDPFGGDYPHLHHVKVIGQSDDLLAAVRRAVAPHAPSLPDSAFSVRPSRAGNYHAVTCSLMVESDDQLRAVYAAVSHIEGVILCL